MSILLVSSPDPSVLRQMTITLFQELPQSAIKSVDVQQNETYVHFYSQNALQTAYAICQWSRKNARELYAQIVSLGGDKKPPFEVCFSGLPICYKEHDLRQLIEQTMGITTSDEVYEQSWRMKADELNASCSCQLHFYKEGTAIQCQQKLHGKYVQFLDDKDYQEKVFQISCLARAAAGYGGQNKYGMLGFGPKRTQ